MPGREVPEPPLTVIRGPDGIADGMTPCLIKQWYPAPAAVVWGMLVILRIEMNRESLIARP